MLYTLNLNSAICQLHLNKIGKKNPAIKQVKKKEEEKQNLKEGKPQKVGGILEVEFQIGK